MKKGKEAIIVLENIRSSENVGSIFRTADALGIEEIVLVGYTPTPKDRFLRPNKAILKTALGAEESVRWSKEDDIVKTLNTLKEKGFEIISIEQGDRAEDYKDVEISEKTAFVFGNEVNGVSKEAMSLSERVVEIPMQGKKESLNVSVAVGVALFRILNI